MDTDETAVFDRIYRIDWIPDRREGRVDGEVIRLGGSGLIEGTHPDLLESRDACVSDRSEPPPRTHGCAALPGIQDP